MRVLTTLSEVLCPPHLTVRELLARLNASTYKFQVVADDDGRLLGTVTDGDVRRAMLRGVGLEDGVAACMQREPVVGAPGQVEANARKLRRVKGYIPFLPVVDAAGRVKEILLAGADDSTISTALIMAGGLGQRLGARTQDTPKPMLPIGDKPILDHIVGSLEAAGIREVYVSVHYLADQIRQFIGARANKARLQVLEERRPLGTAGAIGNLPPDVTGPILVLNGDVLTQVGLAELVSFHRSHAYDATVCVTRYEHEIPFGVVCQSSSGHFERIDEKPRVSHFVAAGIYYLSHEFRTLVPPDTYLDMPDLLNLGREINLKIGLFPLHEYWIDIGRPKDLLTAERDHVANGGQ